MNYQSNLPYPIVQVQRPNINYAKMLMEDYAGSNSEDSAVHLYLYQSLVSNGQFQKYSDILSHISVVEMRHLRMLGEVIKLLGLDPVFGTLPNDEIFRFWTAGNVDYTVDLKYMLQLDITGEIRAIENYERQKVVIQDQYIKSLLSRIIEDEKIHLQIFKDLNKEFFGI